MPSQLYGVESTLPGLLCPFDATSPIILYPLFDSSIAVWIGLGWECVENPSEHNGLMRAVPPYVPLMMTDYDFANVGPYSGGSVWLANFGANLYTLSDLQDLLKQVGLA